MVSDWVTHIEFRPKFLNRYRNTILRNANFIGRKFIPLLEQKCTVKRTVKCEKRFGHK